MRTLAERIAALHSRRLSSRFDLADSPAQVTFHDVPGEPWQLGGATIPPAGRPSRPDGRLPDREGDVTFAYIPDHEPALGVDLASLPGGVDLRPCARRGRGRRLFHDAQLTEDEYEQRVGWGHSSVAHAVMFAGLARARRVVLFHHDPMHTDAQLDELAARARELWRGPGSVPELAVEGMVIVPAAARACAADARNG